MSIDEEPVYRIHVDRAFEAVNQRCQLREPAQTVHRQIEVAGTAAYSFGLGPIDVVVAWRQTANIFRRLDEYAGFVAVLLAGNAGAMRRRSYQAAQNFMVECHVPGRRRIL